MPILAIPILLQLAATCHEHGVPDARMVATAQIESSFRTTALHDNTTRLSYAPETVAEAIALARALLALSHSLDAGIMQVNSQNWARLGLTAETVFDPAANVCAGKAVLAEAYAVERAVSCRYNSGKPNCGSRYPDRIEAAMTAPITVEVAQAPLPLPQPAGAPSRPAAWDVYATTAPVPLTRLSAR